MCLTLVSGQPPLRLFPWRLVQDFLLEDFTADMALRMALSTGNLKLRLDALSRMAIIFIFRGFGKNWYQWLLAVHLADMTRMTNGDTDAWSLLFLTSLSLKGDA